MSSIEKEVADSIENAGFTLSDEAPAELQATENTEQPSGMPEGVTADYDFSSSENNEVVEQQEAVTTEEVSEAQVSDNSTEQEYQQAPAQESSLNSGNNYDSDLDDVDVDGVVLKYLSETLGTELESIDQLRSSLTENKADIDDRVKVIADFVNSTGRSPEDWFKYQSIDTSEMDDLTAVKLSMTSEHPELNSSEIDMLVGNKYKLDEDIYTEEEIQLSKLQLKIDANKSKKSIEDLRSSYMLPLSEGTQDSVQSPIDENWINAMKKETDSFEALTFDLPNGEFNFGISDEYRNSLVDKNANLETFFDQYVDQSGNWDYDTFNAHRALVDNIDAIAKSIYQQGLSDGQRKIVTQAANVSTKSPQVGRGNDTNNLEQQILDALGVDKTLKFL